MSLSHPNINCSNGKDGSESCPFRSWGECLSVVKARSLGKALGNTSGLVPLYRAICIALDSEYPSAANCLSPRRELNQLKCPILNERLNFIYCCLIPMLPLTRMLHCFP